MTSYAAATSERRAGDPASASVPRQDVPGYGPAGARERIRERPGRGPCEEVPGREDDRRAQRDRSLVMREYSATVGATDGNIIAAIITTHAPRNQPNVPRAVQGPSSIPLIRSPVNHHPIAATAKRSGHEAEL